MVEHGQAALSPVVRRLSLAQHVLFLLLLAVGLVRSVLTGASVPWLAVATTLTLAWYAVGLRLARRPASGAGRWWLAGLAGCWLGLVAVSPENVWVAFALWLLAGHFLPLGWAAVFTVATLAVVVGRPALESGRLTIAGVVGPTVGALFALMLSRGQHVLIRDGIERQRLVTDLVAAQQESETLQDELAAAHRESGVLAERTRLSRDIHDTLAQAFSSIVLLARTAEVTEGEDDLRALLARIEGTAGDGLAESRRVVAALAPRDLDGGGLAAALARLVDGVAAETGAATQLRVEGEVSSLPTTLEVALLRTAQGALANVRRHARASRVVVTLEGAAEEVRLDVVDDGAGFDVAAWESAGTRDAVAGGYGLRGARARLAELGGGLAVESAPGEGTALSAHLPQRGAETSQ